MKKILRFKENIQQYLKKINIKQKLNLKNIGKKEK